MGEPSVKVGKSKEDLDVSYLGKPVLDGQVMETSDAQSKAIVLLADERYRSAGRPLGRSSWCARVVPLRSLKGKDWCNPNTRRRS